MKILALLALIILIPQSDALSQEDFPNHMQCFSVRDPLRLRCAGKTNCATIRVPGFVPAGCRLIGSPENTVYCLPGNTEIDSIEKRFAEKGSSWSSFTPTDVPDTVGYDAAQICYKVRCEGKTAKDESFEVIDEFGARTLDKLSYSWMCGPAVEDICEDSSRARYAGKASGEGCGRFAGDDMSCSAAWALTADSRAASCFFASDGSNSSCEACGAGKELSGQCDNSCADPVQCEDSSRQIYAGMDESGAGCDQFDQFDSLCNQAWSVDSARDIPASCYFVYSGSNSSCRACRGLDSDLGRCANTCVKGSASKAFLSAPEGLLD
jgi:hypothetical protein